LSKQCKAVNNYIYDTKNAIDATLNEQRLNFEQRLNNISKHLYT